jgi:hypothetical protein
MKLVSDRKRLRRKYLAGKIRTAAVFMLSYGLMLSGLAGVLLIGGWCFTGPWGILRLPTSFLYFLPLLLMAVAGWFGVYAIQWSGDLMHKAEEMEKGNPYVPPVTAANLPADEILVRASDEPPIVQSECLLRAAQGVETPNEELLRIIQE